MKTHIKNIVDAVVRAVIDFLNKSASKKFVVWIFATHLTYIHILDPQSWLFISLVWLGVQGVLDWKGMPAATIAAGRPPQEITNDNRSNQQLPEVPAQPPTL